MKKENVKEMKKQAEVLFDEFYGDFIAYRLKFEELRSKAYEAGGGLPDKVSNSEYGELNDVLTKLVEGMANVEVQKLDDYQEYFKDMIGADYIL